MNKLVNSDYEPGGDELHAYLREKYRTGLLDLIIISPPPQVRTSSVLHTGTYLGVIEPWLRQYVVDCEVLCRVEAYHDGVAKLSRIALSRLKPSNIISVWVEVFPSAMGEGVFTYDQ